MCGPHDCRGIFSDSWRQKGKGDDIKIPNNITKWYYCWHHGHGSNGSNMATAKLLRIPNATEDSDLSAMLNAKQTGYQ